mgnify:CR=1 FL=1|jgi:glucose/arabinose dehydrogenase
MGVEIQVYVDGADFPTALAIAPDGRLFYTEKNRGEIRVVNANGELLAVPFASVPASSASERGLLGIALHPDFATNGFVYVYYTRSASGMVTSALADVLDNRVVRFTAAGDVAAGPEEVILTLPGRPGPNHNGGQLAFGPDGKLYVTIGELAVAANAQDVNVPTGKILRINDDGSIPADNPFGADNPVFALGIRNSFGIGFDPVSGLAFVTDNGTSGHDEVNRIVAGGNYGWPVVLGLAGDARFIDPLIDFGNTSVVPTGVAFARDATLGESSRNRLFVAQFATGRIFRYELDAERDAVESVDLFAQGISDGITDLEFGPDGTLFVATSRQILRIVPAGG